jgi:hypothetical protein
VKIAVRLQLAEAGPNPIASSPVSYRWTLVGDLEHSTLCSAFHFDPIRHRFDLPKLQRAQAGHRDVSGYVERYMECRGKFEWVPIGTVHVVRTSERFRDTDPTDPRDLFDLRQTT